MSVRSEESWDGLYLFGPVESTISQINMLFFNSQPLHYKWIYLVPSFACYDGSIAFISGTVKKIKTINHVIQMCENSYCKRDV